MFDSHVHLDDPAFDADRDAVLRRAREAGVRGCVTVGSDVASSRTAVALAERYPDVYAAVAIHPHQAGDAGPDALAHLRALLAHPRVVAVGETGLDYARNEVPRDVQREAFVAHLRLSRETRRPVIVHCRAAWDDVCTLLARERPPGVVLHAFSGSPELAADAARRGYMVSLAGPVTFPTARVPVEVVRVVPLEMLLVETDSPVLAPQPWRGRRNEPAFLEAVVRRIAEIRGMDPAEVARITTDNARRVFGLPADGEGR
ncbi:MAG: TatD family hydrolase [Armatimonadota bacterium]|nr:TatD family hydrolase [Armatimonadota bacterium]MDR7436194.1 TatD family hydrolase [Armatimonadota bacterium]MDR7471425.1 TatD family hydrolase [Armatimonadota bacterium]MDR7507200.1 TatD family hydrolase [Armatimonadota bacterium]MDR7509564.1 TatD family hydrolase [Armatimonadota bacterium]